MLGRKEVEGRSGTLLEGESGFNDPVGIALLAVLLTAGTGATAVVGGIGEFLLQMVVGIAVGALGGLALGWAQRRIRLPNEALYPLRTIAFAALIYGAATLLHGSGYLAVFLAGILVGDNRAPVPARGPALQQRAVEPRGDRRVHRARALRVGERRDPAGRAGSRR